jgi:calumenin
MHDYDDEHAYISHIGNITAAKERFSKLDKNNDGYASGPVIELLYTKSL